MPEKDKPPPSAPPTEMTEWEKRMADEPFDSAKLWQEMNDDGVDAITEGFRAGLADDHDSPEPATKPPPAGGPPAANPHAEQNVDIYTQPPRRDLLR
jgi:hypothetical protein